MESWLKASKIIQFGDGGARRKSVIDIKNYYILLYSLNELENSDQNGVG